ncbi:1047_t:CDS:1 [Ambispora gerdemannii]|uniref:1047_t:CDS:1 n=1 Tax=Ambispora gerdemannii TaxID=144530 RepID=A0A9N9F5K1_9GLOM|nr:1047_t:CDS:1 [Ambispora gerdemannii]
MASVCIHQLEIVFVNKENNPQLFYDTGKKMPNFSLLYRMALEISRTQHSDRWTCDKIDCLFNALNTQAREKVSFVFRETWCRLPQPFKNIFKNLHMQILDQRKQSKNDFTILFDPRVEKIQFQNPETGLFDGGSSSSPGAICSIPDVSYSHINYDTNSSEYVIENVEKAYEIKFLYPIWFQRSEIGLFEDTIWSIPNGYEILINESNSQKK